MLKYHDLPALEREKKRFYEFVAVDLAHTAMLVEEGIISAAVGRLTHAPEGERLSKCELTALLSASPFRTFDIKLEYVACLTP